MAPNTTCADARPIVNDLERGATYLATTHRGATTGEYLGIEAPHGDRALLLRHEAGTASVPLASITAIQRAA